MTLTSYILIKIEKFEAGLFFSPKTCQNTNNDAKKDGHISLPIHT